MQQFGFDEAHSQSVHLSEDEARAMAELHAKRREMQSKPTLSDLAAQLGISEAEALAMLTEIRAQHAPPQTPVSNYRPAPQERHISSSMWALISLGAAVIVVMGGLFTFRSLNSSPPPEFAFPADAAIAEGIPPQPGFPAPMPPPVEVHIERDRAVDEIVADAIEHAQKAAEEARAAQERLKR